jgi:hypothetical protein
MDMWLKIVISVLTMSSIATLVFALDIDIRNSVGECGDTAVGYGCESAAPLGFNSSVDGEVNAGTQFTAAGGRAPYSYSFDGGTINSATGETDSINGCSSGGPAAATVTVTDACEKSSSAEVRLSGGTWGTWTNAYNLGFYPPPLFRECTEVHGATYSQQGFFCTSGTVPADATDYYGNAIPDISLGCAHDICGSQHAVAWSLAHTSWTCSQ